MQHEELIKRPDGSKVKIIVQVWLDYTNRKPTYTARVEFCEKGKRKFHSDTKRRVTDAEINQAYEKLWLNIKPPVFVTPDF